MVEKSSLDDDDKIKEHGDAKVVEPKDSLAIIQESMKRSDKKVEEKTILTERNEQVSKEMKKEQKRLYWINFWANIANFFDPDNWAMNIQKYETFLFIVFVDVILLSILFSLLYILYIILNMKSDVNYIDLIFKIGGALCVCILGVVIQVNLPSKIKKE